MLLPCEVAVRSLIPAIRSAIARELIHSHGLKQKDVAVLLGVTQTAISKYRSKLRGTVLNIDEIEEIRPTLSEIAVSLANGQMSKYDFIAKVCFACSTIRRLKLLCNICKISDPLIDVEQCYICNSE